VLAWRLPIWNPFAEISLTPSGSELWRVHRAGIDPSPVPFIYIHDPETGILIDTIPLSGLLPDPAEYPGITDIAFTPDGAVAYLPTGDWFHSRRTIGVLMVEVESRKIIGRLLNDGMHYPYFIDIGPSP
jgi:hypothetical protein